MIRSDFTPKLNETKYNILNDILSNFISMNEKQVHYYSIPKYALNIAYHIQVFLRLWAKQMRHNITYRIFSFSFTILADVGKF